MRVILAQVGEYHPYDWALRYGPVDVAYEKFGVLFVEEEPARYRLFAKLLTFHNVDKLVVRMLERELFQNVGRRLVRNEYD